jgi:hypothetical protein
MVAGIIVTAAADGATAVAAGRSSGAGPVTGWVAGLILVGPALFLAGHAAFKLVIWRKVSWPRVGAVIGLGLLGLLAPFAGAVTLSACAAGVVAAVAVADQVWAPPSGELGEHGSAGGGPSAGPPAEPSAS